MFAIEERHWWYKGMERITLSLLSSLYPGQPGLSVLDAGCGTGAAINYLGRFGTLTGCDISALALEFCRQRELERLSQASVMSLPYSDSSFDLVTSFDVLYHRAVPDYRGALAEFHRVLRPGGRLMVRAPAYDWLRRHHDVATHTSRRLTTGQLARALAGTGFAVEKVTYANLFSLPVAMVQGVVDKALPEREESDLLASQGRAQGMLRGMLCAEARWLALGHRLPCGLSVLAVGKKQ